MSQRRWAGLVARLICVVAFSIGASALPVYADTITGAYSLPLNALKGSFTFNTTSDMFSGTLAFGPGSILFNGVFDDFSQAGACASGSCSLGLSTIVSGDTLIYNINLDLRTDQYSARGKISNTKGQMSWAYTGKAVAVAENWGFPESLGLFALALLAFGVLTRKGVLRPVQS